MTVSTTVAVWVTPPLFAVIVIVYVPGMTLCITLMVRVAVPVPPELRVTLVELRVSLGPVGEQTAERDTVPVKPLILARLIATVPLLPTATLSALRSVVRLKSCTLTVITTECVNEPLVAVTVTV